jgi:hypothetical protein
VKVAHKTHHKSNDTLCLVLHYKYYGNKIIKILEDRNYLVYCFFAMIISLKESIEWLNIKIKYF